MSAATVIFSHGHLSGPDSRKISALAPIAGQCGYDILAIDYRDLRDDPVGRLERLLDCIGQQALPPVLVGSSLGGWVSTAAAERQPVAGLFLMAPALFLEDRVADGVVPEQYHPQCARVTVIHGWGDDIIPWRNSLRFAEGSRATLHLVDSDHRLESALPLLQSTFRAFLAPADQTEVTSAAGRLTQDCSSSSPR